MPATTPADLTPAAQRLLRSASELFYAHGLTAVGVDRIADTAGTTKKTLYDRFGSKDGLILAYLQDRRDRWQAYVLDYLQSTAPPAGIDRVLAVYDALAAWMKQNERGCGFVNAYAELAGTGHKGLEVIRHEKRWVRTTFIELAREAGVPEPELRGAELSILHEGAIVQMTAGADEDALRTARALAERVLDASPVGVVAIQA